MIHPSYVDLMRVVNKDTEEGNEPVISSRYSIVMATSKRARQIIAGDEPMVRVKDKEKPLSVAIDEMNEDKLHILSEEERDAAMREADRLEALSASESSDYEDESAGTDEGESEGQ